MSFINKSGKTSSWRNMVIRQQASDVIAYGQVETTFSKAKETQKHVDRLITLGKKQTLAARRSALAILKDTKELDAGELVKKLFTTLAKKYATRNGGYTRVLKIGPRAGDATEMAIIQLV